MYQVNQHVTATADVAHLATLVQILNGLRTTGQMHRARHAGRCKSGVPRVAGSFSLECRSGM